MTKIDFQGFPGNINFKGFPEERFLDPPPPLFTHVDVSLYQNWTPPFRTLAKSLIGTGYYIANPCWFH
jgi:hypothetical protein